jgi:tight adherence protein C
MTLFGINVPDFALDTGVEVVVAVANFAGLMVLYQALAPSDALSSRARAHARRRLELRGQLLTPSRRKKTQSRVVAVQSLLERLKLTRSAESRKAGELLASAGWRSHDAVTMFLGLRLSLPIGIGILAFFLAPAIAPHASTMIKALIAIAAMILGAFMPTILVQNTIAKRRHGIQKGLPDALDLFVICAEAGLSLDAAMARVGRELGPSWPELADEVGLTAIELGFLPNRRDALSNLSQRVGTPAIRSLVNTLTQTEKYGTPLAQALRVLAAEFRHNRMMKAEEKAARLPATLTVPMIVFILPPLFVVLIGPAIIKVLATFHK